MDADVIIIGSGMGGATLAAALAPTGRRIMILERGEHLSASPVDRDAGAIFGKGVFRPEETWLDGQDRPFNPGNYYYVGGNSKFYGAALIRYRASDFETVSQTPGWPIRYADLERDYQAAEEMYQVRGRPLDDPTEPAHSGTYPHPPVPDEPDIADLRARLKQAGLHPSHIPLGVDLSAWLAAGQTTWDAYPNTCDGKMDAETCGLAAALSHQNVTLRTGARVDRLESDQGGRVTAAVLATGERLTASLFVVAAGAVQSAALLLRSANAHCPTGLANRSDHVGRNFMNHNCSAVLALHPMRKNQSVYQKTLMINDFYQGSDTRPPLGNVQMLGKITGPILEATTPLPRWIAHWIAARSFDFYAMSEDLPHPDSRVTLKNGRIRLDWQRSNLDAHVQLVKELKRVLRRIGFPIVLSQAFDRRTPSHQCGTARMGHDPALSVVNSHCRSHDHPNLFIVDASVLPTSAAVNPALTIAALALRAGRHITETECAA
ncbi:choline dehydrogenase-like flavoprotein [Rubricella aquisinus]|uniref:Choline dehydrogenase-like flavoprotein n=1 Tax=Rubricella aquisinus TaxID=2028108 RepID=A0A840X0F4_9RHOB|nr:GMC family oxidoreductase [Rubricella aquisinus]MBB5515366.1 choline dehydrogenase-like flavoprotein [Rubricella aquisinus]